MQSTNFFIFQEFLSALLTRMNKTSVDILMAHPSANGFHGAPFPLGGIAHAYTFLASQFQRRIDERKAGGGGGGGGIRLHEYRRDGWTFHGKGMWFYPPGETLPLATMVGSPNFGHRSQQRDLEAQVKNKTILICTCNI